MDVLQPSDGSGAFLADILALPAGQVQQKIIKASIAAIGPMKLTVLPDQPPGRLEKRKLRLLHKGREIGRASCRERVCQYVSLSVVAEPLNKKRQQSEILTHRTTQQKINMTKEMTQK